MADRVLAANNVSIWRHGVSRGGILRHPDDWADAVRSLCDSHEALRAELAATRAVARRMRQHWRPDGNRWVRPALGGAPAVEPMTDDQRRALDALEAGDGV